MRRGGLVSCGANTKLEADSHTNSTLFPAAPIPIIGGVLFTAAVHGQCGPLIEHLFIHSSIHSFVDSFICIK